MNMKRLTHCTKEMFLELLEAREPFVCHNAMAEHPGLGSWSPEFLRELLGRYEVQVYGEGFDLLDVYSLESFLGRQFGQAGKRGDAGSLPYVRWYSKQKAQDFVWSCEALDRLEPYWSPPDFMPQSSLLLPWCLPPASLCPSRDGFPARGLFVSPAGARTCWHHDPWASDAVLLQLFGKKLCRLRWDPAFYDTLRDQRDKVIELGPGEALYIPAGWQHEVVTLSDSISLTWNFVHLLAAERFLAYLEAGPSPSEWEVLRFFYIGQLSENSEGSLSDDARVLAELVRGAVESCGRNMKYAEE